MRTHSRVVSSDFYSFTSQGKPWLHHEWLSACLFSWWVDRLGFETLIFWKWAILLVTYLSLFLLLCHLTPGHRCWAALGTSLAALTAAPLLDIRAHLYSLLGYALLLCFFHSGGKARYAIPILVILWVNVHGGYIFALMVLSVLLAVELFFKLTTWKAALALWLSTGLATLVNPYGYKIHSFPLAYAFGEENLYRQNLLEWQSGFWGAPGLRSQLTPLLALLFILIALSWFLPKSRPTTPHLYSGLLLSLMTLLMTVQARRFASFFAISFALILVPFLVQQTRIRKGLPEPVCASILIFLGCGLLWIHPVKRGLSGYLTSLEYFPVDVCDFMIKNNLEGAVFNRYQYGGYLHLRGGGKWPVYIDGRADTIYGQETYRNYLKVSGITGEWMGIVNSSPAAFVLWSVHDRPLLQALVESGHWQYLYSDSVSILLGRSGVDYSALVPPEESAYRLTGLALQDLNQNRAAAAEQKLNLAWQKYPTKRQLELLQAIDKHEAPNEARRERLDAWESHFPKTRLTEWLFALRRVETD